MHTHVIVMPLLVSDMIDITLCPPTYTADAFSGSRPKGSEVDNWLQLDRDWDAPQPRSFEERVDQFRDAYIMQTQLRKAAESRLMRMVRNRMDSQDKYIYDSRFSMPNSLEDGEEDAYDSSEDDGDRRSNVLQFEGEDEAS